MKIRSMFFGAAALAALALAPGKASAQCGPGITYQVVPSTGGLGAYLQGCFTATVQEVGENALGVGSQFFWTNGSFGGNSGIGGNPSNAPLGVNQGTAFTGSAATDNCQNNPGGTFVYCTGGTIPTALTLAGSTLPTIGTSSQTINNTSGEFVIGMIAQDLTQPQQNGGINYWIYSGAQARNSFPAPSGFQETLYQLTNHAGTPIDGEFLYVWEDVNTACNQLSGSGSNPSLQYFDVTLLGVQSAVNDPNNCTGFNPGNAASDNDYNDSYILLNITGTRQDTVVPEPMTMSLMATGLVGLAGAQIRRRKKNQG